MTTHRWYKSSFQHFYEGSEREIFNSLYYTLPNYELGEFTPVYCSEHGWNQGLTTYSIMSEYGN